MLPDHDDQSSSSDDDYAYDYVNSDSDSTDSDYDDRKNGSKKSFLVNGRQKSNANAETAGRNAGVNHGKSDGRRKIRFAGEKVKSSAVTKINDVNFNTEKKRTTITIRSEGSKPFITGERDGKVKSVQQGLFDSKAEMGAGSSGQKSVTAIRIQSVLRNLGEKTKLDESKMKGRNEGGRGKDTDTLRRTDSGIVRDAFSSVSQDTSDSFDKDECRRAELKICSLDRRNVRRWAGQTVVVREMPDCGKLQLDSGFEDTGRLSPGKASPNENRKTPKGRLSRSSEAIDFSNYSNVLRQASLRVFGLVGRKITSHIEAVSKDASAGLKKGSSVANVDVDGRSEEISPRTSSERGVKEKAMFFNRLEEIYKAKTPLLTENSVPMTGATPQRDDENAEEEDEWPEPPSFDEVFGEVDRAESQHDINVPVDKEKLGEQETSPKIKSNSSGDQIAFDARTTINAVLHQNRNHASYAPNYQEDRKFTTNGSQDKSGSERSKCQEVIHVSRKERFQESTCKGQSKLKGAVSENISESRRISDSVTDMNEIHVNGNGISREIGFKGRSIIQERGKSRSPGFQTEPCFTEEVSKWTGEDDGDCAICEIFSSEKRKSRRSADMERFRKTALNDCDAVLKKMRHAQSIAMKMSGEDSPRRSAMRNRTQVKSEERVPVSGNLGIRPQPEAASESTSGGDENQEKCVNAELACSADSTREKGEHTVRFANQPTEERVNDEGGNRKANANGGTAAVDVHVAARQHCKDLIDAGGYLVPNDHKKKGRPKVKRNLSEDFLIVDAMPCSQYKGAKSYDKSRHKAEQNWETEPRYETPKPFETESDHDRRVLPSQPQCGGDSVHAAKSPYAAKSRHDNSAMHRSDLYNQSGIRNRPWREDATRSWMPNSPDVLNTPSRQHWPMHHSQHTTPVNVSPHGTVLYGGAAQASSPSFLYGQQSSARQTAKDPFRAAREKSWFKKAANRLRRSLSFEGNDKKRSDKSRAPSQPHMKACNSSGNLRDECDTCLTQETRGRSYSDEGLRRGISQAAKRAVRQAVNERDLEFRADPNFHPKYGYVSQDRDYVPQGMIPQIPQNVNSSFSEGANSTVARNLYFGNNPSALSISKMQQAKGACLTDYGDSFRGDMVIPPLAVKNSPQKTAKMKFLQLKK